MLTINTEYIDNPTLIKRKYIWRPARQGDITAKTIKAFE